MPNASFKHLNDHKKEINGIIMALDLREAAVGLL